LFSLTLFPFVHQKRVKYVGCYASDQSSSGLSRLLRISESDKSEVECDDSYILSGGEIAGIVLGGLTLIALIVGGVLFALWTRRRRRIELQHESDIELEA
jgi:hypothetical protein